MRRRKIYYVPGMISLIFLPILCVWYLNEHKNVERCIEVSYAEKYDKFSHNHKFDTTALSRPEYKRSYIDIYVSNDDKENQKSLVYLKNKLNLIIKTKNKKLGLHILFSDNCKYNSYIQSINIIEECFKKNFAFHTYCPYQNNIWVLYLLQENTVKPKVYPLNLEGDIVFGRTIKDEINDFIFKNSNTIKIWPFFVIFILFSIISILYIKNKTNSKI